MNMLAPPTSYSEHSDPSCLCFLLATENLEFNFQIDLNQMYQGNLWNLQLIHTYL